MHTDMPQDELGADVVERSRKAWWTAYLLDRQMTSLMGVPQSIHDDDVHSQLPDYPDSQQRRTALAMQIRLSRTMCAINKGKEEITRRDPHRVVRADKFTRRVRDRR
jgi:hypothetical protein